MLLVKLAASIDYAKSGGIHAIGSLWITVDHGGAFSTD